MKLTTLLTLALTAGALPGLAHAADEMKAEGAGMMAAEGKMAGDGMMAAGGSMAGHAMKATYRVTFERTWSEKTHPADFPLLAHFSPVIGVTHDAQYEPFSAGHQPTKGIEMLCEEGKHQPLDGEIRAEIGKGDAGTLIETADPLRKAPETATARFEIDEAHPMVSIGAMIAPSPDWCAFAANVPLFENGAWVAEKSVDLEAFDVGTDSAKTYRALDADMNPKGEIQLNPSAYFVMKDHRAPVGRVTFVRQ